MPDRFAAYYRLMRLDKPIGILLLMWPTLWALWLASGRLLPPPHLLVVFVLGVILMRTAGCVINDVLDRRFDGHVARTQQRPLATGELTVKSALFVFVILSLSALILVSSLNYLTILLACIGFLLVSVYPLAKRYIALPQSVLAVAFSWGVPMAFAAVTGRVPLFAWLLFIAAACWTLAYDTAYAMADREDDIKLGLKSSAILFGRFDRLCIGVFQTLTIFILLLVGQLLELSTIFFIMLLVATCFFIYQQCLLAHKTPKHYFQVFLNNHWVGAVIFLGSCFLF